MSERPADLVWRVVPASAPEVFRRCSRCGKKRPFVSSEKFRVNANKQAIDVWLIYKCSECGSTWNCTIYSRQRVNRIEPTLYERLSRNDEELARRYAFDYRMLEANGAEVGEVEPRVEGDDLDPATLTSPVEVLLTPEFPMNARVSGALASKLGLSKRRLQALVADGSLVIEGGDKELSARLVRDVRVTIHPRALAPAA